MWPQGSSVGIGMLLTPDGWDLGFGVNTEQRGMVHKWWLAGFEGLPFMPVFNCKLLCVLAQPWALSLQCTVIHTYETLSVLGETYCGCGDLIHLKARLVVLNSSEFWLPFGIRLRCSAGTGFKRAEH